MNDHTISLKIISGGQTGVDRAALDAALEAGVEVGGYCPAGREAEDGTIPQEYPLTEVEGGYPERTRRNVEAADATLVIYASQLKGGTAETVAICLQLEKPFKLIDTSLVSAVVAVQAIDDFVRENRVKVLNVAGPRASSNPALYEYCNQILSMYFEELKVART